MQTTAKFVLIVVFLRVKISSALSDYTSTFQAVCAFCSNLTSFTSFPKSEAINIHFIFGFTSLFNLFGFSFSSSEIESSCCFRNRKLSRQAWLLSWLTKHALLYQLAQLLSTGIVGWRARK